MTKRVGFKQADLTRALKAVMESGLEVHSVTIPPEGGFWIDCKDPGPSRRPNTLDRLHERPSQGDPRRGKLD